ncbi:MAG TPA: glycosyltransferase [Pyrinomonadaceae bacterium]|nr:glycosyltransferase [Pyrinomonadaceae bacterium]
MKFAVLSFLVPPSASGMTMALYHLLRGFDGEDYCLISQQDYSRPSPGHDYTELLPASYHTLPDDTIIHRGSRFRLPQRLGHAYIPLGIISRARRIARILRRERAGALVACTGGWDCLNMPAGYLAARMVGIPFYAYVFDYYSKQWEGPNHWGNGDYLRLARRLESLLLKGAAGIIAPNEFLRDALRERYDIEPAVIHNPCDLSRYEMVYQEPQARERGEVKIVYTGDIYDAHFDAFANLMEAIRLLGRPEVKLHAYTIRSIEYLREHGVDGPLVLHPHAPNDSMPEVQRDADVLFLALAFHPPYPEGNKTAAPGKTGEYLAAGRPVLVHAPRDSFASWYFRTHDCGLVVDEDDPSALARGLEQLLTDEALRRRLVANALLRARADFGVEAVREKFARLLSANAGGARRGVAASPERAGAGGKS